MFTLTNQCSRRIFVRDIPVCSPNEHMGSLGGENTVSEDLVSEKPAGASPGASRVDSLLSHPDNLFNRLSLVQERKDEQVVLPAEVVHRKLERTNGRVGMGPGRPSGGALPLTEQVLIGIAARVDGSTRAARVFGVTPSTADGYMDGSRQQGKKDAVPHKELKERLDATLGKAREGAADRILKSIETITDKSLNDNLKDKPLAAASLALTLSTVVEKLSPKEKGGEGNRVQVIIHAFDERPEDRYDLVEVPLTAEER